RRSSDLGRINMFYIKVVRTLGNVYNEISTPNGIGVVYVRVVLFLYIALNNGMGLIPFVFTGTRHLVITLSVGLVAWLSFFLIG
ncbi:hypothetical protein, partial [Pseudoalteromonas sp. BMB]|uniref:hypothetical protein n=1 Tax=Pseudoalteromonas sp. BMB TaxID=1874619 RepID=UPI001C2F14A5